MLIAISAPARSIDATAMSISRSAITSRIGMWSTSTSYMLASTVSGSIPWLMVRFPCGSRSMASTRWPDSAKATARLRVVVVFATPPFWLANEMIWALRSDPSPMWAPGILPSPGSRDGLRACSALSRPSSSGSGSDSGRRLRDRLASRLRFRLGVLLLGLGRRGVRGRRRRVGHRRELGLDFR